MQAARRALAAGLCWAPLALAAPSGSSPFPRLEPSAVWAHFDALCQLPRCSGDEGAAAEYARAVAERLGLEVVADTVGNLVITRPASGLGSQGGAEGSAEPVVVHSHLDMACDARDGARPTAEPIQVTLRDDGWAVAEKSSLGAGSGVGVAVALALLEEPSDARMPPLEVLLTVQGKSGFIGARGLNASLISGRRMLNLDAEEHGVLVVGSAGAARVKVNLPVSGAALRANSRTFMLALRGLTGGHSGLDIHLGRANALVALARAIAAVRAKLQGAQLISLEGGRKDDSIPREAFALLGLPLADLPRAREVVGEAERDLLLEFGRTDPHLQLRLLQPEHADDTALSEESAERLLDLLLLLPLGVLRSSAEIPGAVETSNSIARVRQAGEGIVEVLCLARSSLPPGLESLRERIDRAARRVVATAAWGPTVPGWHPNRSSPLLSLALEAFRKVEGRAAELALIHTGLEAAALRESLPGLDIVSYGPDVAGARAPGECVRVDSVEKTWELTRQLLARLADAGAEGGARTLDL